MFIWRGQVEGRTAGTDVGAGVWEQHYGTERQESGEANAERFADEELRAVLTLLAGPGVV